MAWVQQLLLAFDALNGEWLATVLACIFLLFALVRQRWCWLFAALSVATSVASQWRQEATFPLLLNGAYLLIVCYGGWRWSRCQPVVEPGRLAGASRVYWVATLLALALVVGFWFDYYALARAPYAEALILGATLVFVVLLAHRVIECWYCLFLAEALSVMLALQGGQQTSAALHCWYMTLAVVGIVLWANVISSKAVTLPSPARR